MKPTDIVYDQPAHMSAIPKGYKTTSLFSLKDQYTAKVTCAFLRKKFPKYRTNILFDRFNRTLQVTTKIGDEWQIRILRLIKSAVETGRAGMGEYEAITAMFSEVTTDGHR